MGASAPDLAAVFEHLPNAFMILDRELRYVGANAAYMKVTGSTREHLIGSHVFESFPDDPDDPNSANVALLRASFERVFATGAGEEIAAIIYHVARTPGGPLEERVWSARHTPILGEDGTVAFVVQETSDVTHLRAAAATHSSSIETTVLDRAVRAAAAASLLDVQLRDLRQMFAQAPGFMCFLRTRGHVFELTNAAYMQLIGHRDVIGMRVADALPEVVGQGFIDLLDRVFTTGEPFIGKSVGLKLQRTPGAHLEDRYLDFIYQPIRDLTGAVVGIFVQGQDVTPEHEAEARRKFLIESIPVQVWTSTREGQLDFVSERVVSYFQRTAEQMLGDGWLGVIHPEDVADCVARWTRSLTTGDPYEVEFRLRRADGMYRWHLARAHAERDTNGAIMRWLGTNTDIHEAKSAAAELRARAEYEQRLIGIVSHDLRNPLGSVSLAATLLSNMALPPAAEKTLTRLSRSADRATRLINDLLDFAKSRIGTTIPINRRPTNLREIIEQVVDEFQTVAPARIIRVGHSGAEDGSWDADRIAQVISNLVGNAIQHGTPTVPISVESRIEGDDAVLAVRNAGPPIPDGELEHLFEPFKRGSNASSATGSMGLGLYIAREVVVAHGGTIQVESLPGEGTCFTVRLPRFAAIN